MIVSDCLDVGRPSGVALPVLAVKDGTEDTRVSRMMTRDNLPDGLAVPLVCDGRLHADNPRLSVRQILGHLRPVANHGRRRWI